MYRLPKPNNRIPRRRSESLVLFKISSLYSKSAIRQNSTFIPSSLNSYCWHASRFRHVSHRDLIQLVKCFCSFVHASFMPNLQHQESINYCSTNVDHTAYNWTMIACIASAFDSAWCTAKIPNILTHTSSIAITYLCAPRDRQIIQTIIMGGASRKNGHRPR